MYEVGGGSNHRWLFWEWKEKDHDLGVLNGSTKEGGVDLGDCKEREGFLTF